MDIFLPISFYSSGLCIFLFSDTKIHQQNLQFLLIFSLFLGVPKFYDNDNKNGILQKISLSKANFLELSLAKICAYFLNPSLPMLIITTANCWVLFDSTQDLYQFILINFVVIIVLITICNLTALIVLGAKNPDFLAIILAMPFILPMVIFANLAFNSEVFWQNFALLCGFGGLISLIMMAAVFMFTD